MLVAIAISAVVVGGFFIGWSLLRLLGAALLCWVAFPGIAMLLGGEDLLGRVAGMGVEAWLAIAAVAGLALAYIALIARLRLRAKAAGQALPGTVDANTTPKKFDPSSALAESELDRYARHLVLREIGGPGQMRLRQARVLVVGAGGLGAPISLYLAASGVGRIILADDDVVSRSNLQRQVLYADHEIGQSKVLMAAARLRALNPDIEIISLNRRIGASDMDTIGSVDLVLDGSDRFETRQMVNNLCVQAGVPLISGAVAQWEGQLGLYDPARGGPCYSCVFPQAPAAGLAPDCAQAGVAGPLPGVIGTMMALEAVKFLAGAGSDLRGRLVLFDGLYAETRMVTVGARTDCEICAARQNPHTP